MAVLADNMRIHIFLMVVVPFVNSEHHRPFNQPKVDTVDSGLVNERMRL